MSAQTPAGAALRELVPELMAGYDDIVWQFDDGSDALCIVMSPVGAPERVARVLVHHGEEVFALQFGSHVGVTFAYQQDEKPDELRDRIATAVATVRGPSRLVLTFAGTTQTRSELVLAPDSPDEHSDGVWMERQTAELLWRVRRRRLRREVRDFPRL
ncbi:hypothetical protein ACIOWF_00310 [Cellulosimicrobium cellulans]|nr:hypothetical protein [Cellulosimicrobium cellulans]